MDVTIKEVYQDFAKNYGSEKACKMVLDVITMGFWASWDDEKIKKAMQDIKNKYEKKGA